MLRENKEDFWMVFKSEYLFDPEHTFDGVLNEHFTLIEDGAYEGQFVETENPMRSWEYEEIKNEWMVDEGFAFNVEIPFGYFKTEELARKHKLHLGGGVYGIKKLQMEIENESE